MKSPPSPTPVFPSSLFYEPTSVLDPHLTNSPAFAAAGGGVGGGGGDLPPLPWDLVPLPPPPPSDDWDPISAWLLSEKDDLPPKFHDADHQIPQFHPQIHPPEPQFDRHHLDLLLRAAASVESGDLDTAHSILARLNHYPTGSPLQRAAFHFRDALMSILPISDPPLAEPPFTAVELVRKIAAQKSLSDLSPIPQFAGFTANQTLLEALDGASALHLIDFDLGLGGQWSSFAQEVSARSAAARRNPPPIRITAVVMDDSPDAALAADNLRDFAAAIGVRLSVDFVRVGGLGALALGGVRLGGGESAAAVLSPAVFRLLGGTPESDAALLRFVRRSNPRVVVFVDTEPDADPRRSPPSFCRNFAGGLEFYTTVLESLDAAAGAAGVGAEPVGRIERAVIRPRVFASVGSSWTRSRPWRETFLSAGMQPVAFSDFTESQAEWLLRRARVDGFHVARREGSMVLTWRGRELAATSAWRC